MTIYTDAAQIATYLGRALTVAEAAAVPRLISAASMWIDGETGRAWGPAMITDEVHRIVTNQLHLFRSPVASITSVSARAAFVGAGSQSLAAGSGYELVDPAEGLLLIRPLLLMGRPSLHQDRPPMIVTVSYVVTDAIPDNVALAATILSASWLRPTSDRYRQAGVKSYQSGQDIQVSYAADTSAIPGEVTELLATGQRDFEFA